MAMKDQIPRDAMFWLLGLLLLLIAPHAVWLPLWVLVLTVLCMGWRILIHFGKAGYPPFLVRALLVFCVVPLSIFEFRGQGAGLGVDVSVCLLVLGAAFKLLEMRFRRDIYILITLAFLLAMTGFIYSQTLQAALYNLFVVTLIITAMVLLNRDNRDDHATQLASLRLAGVMILQSLPVMLILFVLVPRIPPLWSMQMPTGGDKTGVSDEMTPGEISRLGRSGELAFRVKFDAEAPPHEQLYWRGLVLDAFDGQTWKRSNRLLLAGEPLEQRLSKPVPSETSVSETYGGSAPLSYDVILEPTQQDWLYGIKVAQVDQPDVMRDRYDTLQITRPVNQQMRYLVRSYPDMISDAQLSPRARERALQLPEGNPRSRAMAAQLRGSHGSDRERIQALLRHYNEQAFYYTLTPQTLSGDSIDAFLFDSREGFCGHYAGSFVFLLRAAGIPARVVVGYQGAEYNPFEDYMMVYQYNAHAWAEVWLEGEGWVRFDPTAWVAPERITQGVEAFFGERTEFVEDERFSMLRGTAWLNTLRLRLDAMEYSWNRWVLSYDSEQQSQLLEDVFGEESDGLGLVAMIVLIGLTTALLALLMYLRGRRPGMDPVLASYLQFNDLLASRGLPRLPAEGPLEYSDRISEQRPDLAADVHGITRLAMQLMYVGEGGRSGGSQHLRDLRRRVRALRRSLAGR